MMFNICYFITNEILFFFRKQIIKYPCIVVPIIIYKTNVSFVNWSMIIITTIKHGVFLVKRA